MRDKRQFGIGSLRDDLSGGVAMRRKMNLVLNDFEEL